jgi:hypothetical protein
MEECTSVSFAIKRTQIFTRRIKFPSMLFALCQTVQRFSNKKVISELLVYLVKNTLGVTHNFMDRRLNVERPNVKLPNVELPPNVKLPPNVELRLNVEHFECRILQHWTPVVPTLGDERPEFLSLVRLG